MRTRKQFRRPRKFPVDVARFFNPQKSGTNAIYDLQGRIIRLGTHQEQKRRERSYIVVSTPNYMQ